MKIAFFDTSENDESLMREVFPGEEITFFKESLSVDNAREAKEAEIVSVFVGSQVSSAVIDQIPSLKYIATRSTGFNHIDVEYARQKGIQVANVPGYGSHTVAEFAFGLLLSLSRKIASASNYVRDSLEFNYSSQMEGFDLAEKTLGVVGTGKIGKNMIRIAKGFSMEVVAYDPHPDEAYAAEQNMKYVSLEEVLEKSDIISLHAPYTKDTHHIINRNNISFLKRGAYIINTARGELIDTEALVWGLENGIVGAAGLDVLENEADLKNGNLGAISSFNRSLMKMQNVIVTPHIAFYTREAVDEILNITVNNIKSFLSGQPINLIK